MLSTISICELGRIILAVAFLGQRGVHVCVCVHAHTCECSAEVSQISLSHRMIAGKREERRDCSEGRSGGHPPHDSCEAAD